MRTIVDQNGRLWDVVTGRESYGVRVLLYCSRDGNAVRKSALDSTSSLFAENEFQLLSDYELRQRLAHAEIWS